MNRQLSKGNISTILSDSITTLSDKVLFLPTNDSPEACTIYYITCWLLNAASKEVSWRGRSTHAEWIDILVNNCRCIDAVTAKDAKHPTEKVEHLQAYGGLCYPLDPFY